MWLPSRASRVADAHAVCPSCWSGRFGVARSLPRCPSMPSPAKEDPLLALHRVLATLSLPILAVGLLTAGCSSDSNDGGGNGDTTTTTTATADDTNGNADTTTTASGDNADDAPAGADNPDVEAYCADAEELAADITETLSDRENLDPQAIEDINARAAALSETAATLLDAHPDFADRLNDCAQLLTDATATQAQP